MRKSGKLTTHSTTSMQIKARQAADNSGICQPLLPSSLDSLPRSLTPSPLSSPLFPPIHPLGAQHRPASGARAAGGVPGGGKPPKNSATSADPCEISRSAGCGRETAESGSRAPSGARGGQATALGPRTTQPQLCSERFETSGRLGGAWGRTPSLL